MQGRKKIGEPEGSPRARELSRWLEGQLQSELDVASFVGRLASIAIDATLLCLDEGSGERADIEV